MAEPKVEGLPYNFAGAFERRVAWLCCTSPGFMGRCGHALDAVCLAAKEAVLVVMAAQAIFKDHGAGPRDWALVEQRLAGQREQGKITHEAIQDAGRYLDADLDPPTDPPEEAVIAELVPLLRQRIMLQIATTASAAYAKGGKDDRKIAELLNLSDGLGRADQGAGVRMGVASFDEIEHIRHLQHLPTGIDELDFILSGGPARGTFNVVMAGAKVGKCHAKGQGVLLADGTIRKVEDVRVGDLLMGWGGFRRVLATNRGRGEMFDIVPKRGAPWRVNADHILTLVRTGVGGEMVDVSVKELGTWSAKRKRAFMLTRSPGVEFAQTSLRQLPLDPYFLGVLLGDGSLGGKSPSIGVTTADPEIVTELHAQAARYNLRVRPASLRYAPTYRLSRIPEYAPHPTTRAGRRKKGVKKVWNRVTTRLESLGLRGKTSGDKFIPQAYRVADPNSRRQILAGLIDTDGYLAKAGLSPAYEFTLKSRQLVEDIAFIARSLGLAASRVVACQKTCQTGAVGTYYRTRISGEIEQIPVRVARKRAPPFQRKRKDVRKVSFTVRPAGEEDYYGFTLDGDGRYLLDDFTVTHNSIFMTHCAAQAMMLGLNVCVATLELSVAEWFVRVKSNLTGIPIDAIKDGSMERAREMLAGRPLGNLVVKWFPSRGTGAREIIQWVEDEEQRAGAPVSLCTVDYLQKLKPRTEPGGKRWDSLGDATDELRDWSMAKKIWTWTGAQPQRGAGQERGKKSSGASRIGTDDVAGSMEIVRNADLIVTLTGVDDDKIEYYIAGGRYGGTGRATPALRHEFPCAQMVPLNRTLPGAEPTGDLPF